jgi:predicted nucleic acid-binding protein
VKRILIDTSAYDALIAMTARTEGMRVFTRNGSDFARIAAIEPFDLEIVT